MKRQAYSSQTELEVHVPLSLSEMAVPGKNANQGPLNGAITNYTQ